MARTSLWVGLDVGADHMSVCGTDDQGAVLFEHSIPSNAVAFHALLKAQKRRIKIIGLESGSFGITLCRSLRRLGYPATIFEARQASKFLAIRRNKTDDNDARGLAEIGRLARNSVSEVHLKTTETQRIRSALATRRKLVQLRVALENTIRSLFRLNGGKLKSAYSAANLKRNVELEIRRLRKCNKTDLKEEVEPLLSLSLAMRTYIEKLDARLSKRAEEEGVCRRFLEIPGVGPLTALSFYSAIEDPSRFRRNSAVGAYLGLSPLHRQSGQSVVKTRISKMGDKMTRAYLITAAQHHVHHANSAVATWAAALSKRLGKRAVQAAVARKLAITMLAMWKSGLPYDPYHANRPANLQRVL
jgi:transposase